MWNKKNRKSLIFVIFVMRNEMKLTRRSVPLAFSAAPSGLEKASLLYANSSSWIRKTRYSTLFTFSATAGGTEKVSVLETRQTGNAIARFLLPQRTLRVLIHLFCSTPKGTFGCGGRRDALRLLLFRPPRVASKKLRCSRNSSPQMLSRICGCFMRTLRVL